MKRKELTLKKEAFKLINIKDEYRSNKVRHHGEAPVDEKRDGFRTNQ